MSNTGQTDRGLVDALDGSTPFTCYEEECGVSADMGCYLATAEQYIAHWNAFHVAITPTITCVVNGCSDKCAAGPESVDAFLSHVAKTHPELSQGGHCA